MVLPSEIVMFVGQTESTFAKAYASGLNKRRYWEPVYEDSMNLIAKLPEIAALIYRTLYKGGKIIPSDPNLDWAGNLAHMMGTPPPPPAPSLSSFCAFAT